MQERTKPTTQPLDVEIPTDGVSIPGVLEIPNQAKAIVIFAHGTGNARLNRSNRRVAEVFRQASLATLRMDFLDEREQQADIVTRNVLFDVGFLAARIEAATHWVSQYKETRDMSIGYFGTSTGAAAALTAAVHLHDRVGAVVSRAGRVDLAETMLPHVKAPTLLLIGEDDSLLLELTQETMKELHTECKLVILPDGGHTFKAPKSLETVAQKASSWFVQHLVETQPSVSVT